jgi:ankyrin repeat protein
MMKEHPELCVEVFRFEAFPQDLLHPLHMLCALSAKLETIKLCVKCCAAALFHDQSSIGAPIHYACTFNNTFDVIRWLVKKDSDALELPNMESGMTPLHLAIQHKANFDTVAFLTDRCPAAAAMVDNDMMTPLHRAIAVTEPELEVIEDLTEVCPEACEMMNVSGLTPLLLGIQLKVDVAILRDLIISNPKSAAIKDSKHNNATPLHRAIEMKIHVKVLKDLLRADPISVETKDSIGNLPVHTAVEVGITTIDLYQILACQYPDGLEIENDDGMTPHLLAQNRMPKHPDIIEFLNPYEDIPE